MLDTSAAGEAVRNVISSPLSGLDPTAVLDIRPIVTHTLPLEQFERGFELILAAARRHEFDVIVVTHDLCSPRWRHDRR